jgi:hypothetical protein
MEIFDNNHMEDGGDYTEAEQRLDFLQVRKGKFQFNIHQQNFNACNLILRSVWSLQAHLDHRGEKCTQR